MNPSLILLFNHRLTQAQEADARSSLGVGSIVAAPPEISTIWAGIPPAADAIAATLDPVVNWLATEGNPGDFVLIQGDFGATYLMVNAAIRLGLIPVYSTTQRQAVEEHKPDGSVHIGHIFSHVQFRRYQVEADSATKKT